MLLLLSENKDTTGKTISKMFVCLVLGAVMVAQKARNDRAPEAVMVNPMFVL